MRKILIILLCVALAWGTYQTIAVGFHIGDNFSVANYKEVSDSSREIDTLISTLSNVNDIQFAQSKSNLEQEIKNYKNVKEEYDELAATAQTEEGSPEISLVDIYDVDFLWTAIGNYGTEEGISLKFDITRSMSSYLESQNYTMCDLKFTVSGEYIALTDFIYDLEDDNKLGFEISDFSLAKGGDNLQATFTVKNVPINNKNLTEITTSVSSSPEDESTSSSTNTNTTSSSTTSSSSSDTNTASSSSSSTNTVN